MMEHNFLYSDVNASDYFIMVLTRGYNLRDKTVARVFQARTKIKNKIK